MSNNIKEGKKERIKIKKLPIKEIKKTNIYCHRSPSINKTNTDSLTEFLISNDKECKTTLRKENNRKIKYFYEALDTIKQKIDFSLINKTIHESEYSENIKASTKDYNISNYVKKPLVKKVFKFGNELYEELRNPKVCKNSGLKNAKMTNIEERDSEDEEELNQFCKKNEYNRNTYNYNLSSNISNTNNISTKKSSEKKDNPILINDLDEDQDIIMKDYIGKTKLKFDNEVKEVEVKDNNNYLEIEKEIEKEMELNEKTSNKIYIVDNFDPRIQKENNKNNINSDEKEIDIKDNNSFQINSDNNSIINKEDVSGLELPQNLLEIMIQDGFENNLNMIEKINLESDEENNNYNFEGNNLHTPKAKIKHFLDNNYSYKKNKLTKNNEKVKCIRYNKKRLNKSNIYKEGINELKHTLALSNLSIISVFSSNIFKPETKHFRTATGILKMNHTINNKNNNTNVANEDVTTIYDNSFLQNLCEDEKKFLLSINYIKKNSKINIKNRTEIYFFIMDLCEDYSFKRDTFHYAIYNLERYISYLFLSKNKIDKNLYYLSAVACLDIAAKVEEVQIPKMIGYIKSLNNTISSNYKLIDLIRKETEVLKGLNFSVIPITINTWLNWHLSQWDLFVDLVEGIKDMFLEFCDENEIMYFKTQDDKSYYNFRRVTQLVDYYMADFLSLQYSFQYLVMGAIYSNLLICYNNSQWIDFFQNKNTYKKIYHKFINESFGCEMSKKKEFLLTLNFCKNNFFKKFTFELPLIYQINDREIENSTYEDFISYQTTNAEFRNSCKKAK